MDVFQDKCRYFDGLSLITERGKLNTFKTITQNNLLQFIKDIKNLNLDHYDLVISDFEPVTAWAAKLKDKQSIGISHQCAFHHDIPKVKGYLSAKALMKIFAPTQTNIGLHWHHFNQPILPPLVEPHTRKTPVDNKILVYMGFETINDIKQLIQPFNNYQFVIYAKVEKEKKYDHITIKPLSTQFHQDLEDACGVISNAGFELASECLLLGKKLLIKPLTGQYEQLSNALVLQTMNRATVMKQLDQNILQEWLETPSRKPVNYPNVAAGIAKWLIDDDLNNIDSLVTELWTGVDTGFYIDEKLEDKIIRNLN